MGFQPANAESVVVVAAGDIATCSKEGDDTTAALLDSLPGIVLILGDAVYPSGALSEFLECYGPNWGRHKARTRPAPGNSEYDTPEASGYFDYFGEAAGAPGKGYYSYDYGSWHLVVLNSACRRIGGCSEKQLMVQWLKEDLAANPAKCTLAYFHHPLFSSGPHGNDPRMRASWRALFDGGADVVLSGHDHIYERFAPQTPDGSPDPERGIRQFVVGTGGASHGKIGEIKVNSEVRNADTYGVLKLTLNHDSYDWEFIPVEGSTFTDAGSGACH
jgi:hypothetical protein